MSGRTIERILNAAAKGLLFLLLYVMLGLCWIGAECASLRASCMIAGLTALCWRGSAG